MSVQTPNIRQRSIMRCLGLNEWRIVRRLPIAVGAMALGTMARNGWVDVRGVEPDTEARLTHKGDEAMRGWLF
jgi:hypothetical protein